MAVITISRGTFAGGQALAERLAKRLNYQCLSREVIFDAAKEYGVSPERLSAALEKPPSFWQHVTGERSGYLNYVRAALCDRAKDGNLVYHGHAGHLLLAGISHVIRVRVIADMEYRIIAAMERLNLARKDAISYIEKVDEDRRKWTRFLYGVEWDDASLYDVILNLEHLDIADACEAVVHLTTLRSFQPTPESMQAMADLALGSRVAAVLTRDARTAGADLKVEAHHGVVTVTGIVGSQRVVDSILTVASAVEGVEQVKSEVSIGRVHE